MLGITISFLAGVLFGFLVLGYRIKRLRNLLDLEIPFDSMVTFAVFDEAGNQLTERALGSIGSDGRNMRDLLTPVIRSGRIHHGVSYLGECGAVMNMDGAQELVRGQTFGIKAGDWHTDLRPEDKPS